jgi:hypothetical protein
MKYYVYEYLRADGTPYYVGKGQGKRWRNPHTVAIPPKERIKFVAEGLDEQTAFKLEEELILKYGRKDLGTGILRNQTSGGEGQTPGPEVRAKLSAIKKGKRPNNYGKTMSYKQDRKWDRQGEKHHQYGKERTDEERQKISEGIKANWDRPIQTCPHCGKQGKVNMTRWHFDNCKHKS